MGPRLMAHSATWQLLALKTKLWPPLRILRRKFRDSDQMTAAVSIAEARRTEEKAGLLYEKKLSVIWDCGGLFFSEKHLRNELCTEVG
ncbi:hypothetical protein CARUB_v10021496mg [Capsella rubella]|uniref:Uncharacterized protein n=1 Tax=Capsella rubella TaxID=81985 RepID=R0I7H9_9BRAS|nr:hypothetical protein CARUB_v10021496mg [Capsella rubella]